MLYINKKYIFIIPYDVFYYDRYYDVLMDLLSNIEVIKTSNNAARCDTALDGVR